MLMLLVALPHVAEESKTPSPSPSPSAIKITGSFRSRLEAWNWFDNPTTNPYAFSGNILRLNFQQTRGSWMWNLELAAPILLFLPETGGGQGINYYTNNHRQTAAGMVFAKQGYLRWNGEKTWAKLGRFEFMDGAELVAKNGTIAAVKRDRVAQRLIGTFGFTHVGRSFDGYHFNRSFKGMTLTSVSAVPTRGVFQVDGWGPLATAFSYLSLANTNKDTDWRAFAIYSHDWRHISKTAGQTGNLRIATFGGHFLHTLGPFDMLFWGAVQTGRWGNLDHRATAGLVEAGWQAPPKTLWKPWIRAGITYGSGDRDAKDGRHGTFFQILPTPRPFARFPFYNMMNSVDRNASLTLRPTPKLTLKSEIHSLRLAEKNDLWYQGGGAYQPWTFGYTGRDAKGATGLANLYDVSADWNINPKYSLAAYFGYSPTKAVLQKLFPGSTSGAYGYVEATWRF